MMKIKYILPLASLLLVFACSKSPSPIPNPNSLADYMVGTYVGEFKRDSANQSTTEQDYSITVTKISDNEVQFAPTNGSISYTFTEKLKDGSIEGKAIIDNGSRRSSNEVQFLIATGELNYLLGLETIGGKDRVQTTEIFSGIKQ